MKILETIHYQNRNRKCFKINNNSQWFDWFNEIKIKENEWKREEKKSRLQTMKWKAFNMAEHFDWSRKGRGFMMTSTKMATHIQDIISLVVKLKRYSTFCAIIYVKCYIFSESLKNSQQTDERRFSIWTV